MTRHAFRRSLPGVAAMIATLVLSGPVRGQPSVEEGDRVRVSTVTDLGRLTGVVGSFGSDGMSLRFAAESTLVFPLSSIDRVERLDGTRSLRMTGLGVGAGIGAMTGAIAGALTKQECGPQPPGEPPCLSVHNGRRGLVGGLIGGAIGAAVGYLIGAGIRADNWETVWVRGAQVNVGGTTSTQLIVSSQFRF